jgi:hypothetical protein
MKEGKMHQRMPKGKLPKVFQGVRARLVFPEVNRHPDPKGCVAVGEAREEALADLEGPRRLWPEAAHEHGNDIPPPSVRKGAGLQVGWGGPPHKAV